MRLGKHQIADLRSALEIAIMSEEEFARAHIKQYTDGEIMDGFADVVADTRKRIERFRVLSRKLREEGNG